MCSSIVDNCDLYIRTEYPYIIEKYSSITIELEDNIKLAATIWMPKNKNEELRKEEKFASILEYLPNRKSDFTDEYWRSGSVCEDYSKILCPVLLIGGFANLYTDAIFRLINKLKCPKRAILEIISVYKLNSNINELHSIIKERKGKWIHFNNIPFYPNEHLQKNDYFINDNQQINQKQIKYYLSFGSLTLKPTSNNLFPNKISFLSPQQTGISSENLCGFGYLEHPSNSIDKREDDGRSLCFDSPPLSNDYELFGFPTVKLNLSSSSQVGLICIRLCMIDQNTSSSILIARSVLNLTHYQSHQHPKLLNIDQFYNIEVTSSDVYVCLPAGCRLRLALSTSYWPIVWPSSQQTTLTLIRDDFTFPEVAQGIQIKELRQYTTGRFRIFDEINQTIILKINENDGSIEYPDGLIWDEKLESIYKINNNDPQSARIEILRYLKYYFKNEPSIKVDIQTKSIMLLNNHHQHMKLYIN